MKRAPAPETLRIRRQIDHPVIDADGHAIEYLPCIYDLVRDLGGAKAVDGFRGLIDGLAMIRSLSPDDARRFGAFRMGWWGLAVEATDRASVMLPRLFHERLDELGLDLAIVYPTYGLLVIGIHDPDVRIPVARAFNRYYAEEYGPYRDRILPAATIPMHTPEEAVAELEHAVGELGLKVAMLSGHVVRPRPGSNDPRGAHWIDTFGVNTAHDYDPFWRRCADLRVAPTFHSSALGLDTHDSPTNYVYNKIGSFAGSLHALCRSLVLGGITHRFPSLRFAFLEGGAGWAAMLYADIVAHWRKRNTEAVRQYDPRRLDRARLRALFEEYGSRAVRDRAGALDSSLHPLSDPDDPAVDDFERSGIGRAEDVRRVFAERLFFGCEADDPTNAWAFDARVNPLGLKLNALFGSDIAHWDVPDLREAVAESHELVDEGLMSAADYRSFVFANAVDLWGGPNPDFFAGTVVEEAARRHLTLRSRGPLDGAERCRPRSSPSTTEPAGVVGHSRRLAPSLRRRAMRWVRSGFCERPLRRLEDEARMRQRRIGVVAIVLLRRDEVLVAVEAELALLAELLRDADDLREPRPHFLGELTGVLFEQRADVVPLRRLDPDVAEHRLGGELDELLRLAHDVGVAAAFLQELEHLEPNSRLLEVGARQARAGHSSITSPGLRSGLRTQYQRVPFQTRCEPSSCILLRRRSRTPAKNRPRSITSRASSTMSRKSGLPRAASSGRLNTGERSVDSPAARARASAGAIALSTAPNSAMRFMRPRGRSSATTRTSRSESGRALPRPTDPKTTRLTSRVP
jgi:predicted TIM-barrel fold metal-dependent hydrolase